MPVVLLYVFSGLRYYPGCRGPQGSFVQSRVGFFLNFIGHDHDCDYDYDYDEINMMTYTKMDIH